MKIIEAPLYAIIPGTRDGIVRTLVQIMFCREFFVVDIAKDDHGNEENVLAKSKEDYSRIFDREYKKYSEQRFISESGFKELELESVVQNLLILHEDYNPGKVNNPSWTELIALLLEYKSYLEENATIEGKELIQAVPLPEIKSDPFANQKESNTVVKSLLLRYLDFKEGGNPFIPNTIDGEVTGSLLPIMEALTKLKGPPFYLISPVSLRREYVINQSISGRQGRTLKQLQAAQYNLLKYKYTGNELSVCLEDIKIALEISKTHKT